MHQERTCDFKRGLIRPSVGPLVRGDRVENCENATAHMSATGNGHASGLLLHYVGLRSNIRWRKNSILRVKRKKNNI